MKREIFLPTTIVSCTIKGIFAFFVENGSFVRPISLSLQHHHRSNSTWISEMYISLIFLALFSFGKLHRFVSQINIWHLLQNAVRKVKKQHFLLETTCNASGSRSTPCTAPVPFGSWPSCCMLNDLIGPHPHSALPAYSPIPWGWGFI